MTGQRENSVTGSEPPRRIERGTSRTAEWVCVVRACSYRDRDPQRHSDDWVAAAIVPGFMRFGAGRSLFRRLWGRLSAPGMYEWVVARTRFVDDVFRSAGPRVRQVVILGAGYDSRAIRFCDELAEARVFEVDAPEPQADKRHGLDLRDLHAPSNLAFVPADFEKTTAAECLAGAGFLPGMPTLYLLEGLTMYLTPEAVEQTLDFASSSAGAGSMLVFDYAYADVIAGKAARYGAAGVMARLSKGGEAWRFGVEEGGIGELLARHGFEVVDGASPAELEKRYLTDERGRLHGRVNGTQAIVTARRI